MPEPGKPVDTRLVIGPNASLSRRQALVFFAGLSAVALTIAAVFAAMGFWPILPFAGLELAAVGAALWVAMRDNHYREVLVFDADHVRVEFGRVGEGVRARCEWPRASTRVWLERDAAGRTVLVLSCGPSRLELGSCLTDAERAALAKRIRELIHPAWLQAGALSEPSRPGLA